MSLLFPTTASSLSATRRAPRRLRLRWPLIAALGLNLVLWFGIIQGVRSLIG